MTINKYYFNRQRVESALADLERNKNLKLEQARLNGWEVEVLSKCGLTTWRKKFGFFVLSQDMVGQKGLSTFDIPDRTWVINTNFRDLSDLERDGWISSEKEAALQSALLRPARRTTYQSALLRPARRTT
ncbi:MAG: hypothetical protein AN483_12850 [Aphanizomenon flos-aquae MDT14a]|jgi:hypothetical protein|uniref:Uncharacterized protein n=1 Tax=Aphanizomenon flos-aquae WA102 TaxID=1710896 RepID=A0A1B7X2M3_APHFL|nr:MAG: hypothetical protein AN483_12850 [Aphanizomenon flos-aquae MDT14a]OBQ43617.1 MAG: hypothetical protein AN484_11480 [Aphanizomenon flos-aquae WA102]